MWKVITIEDCIARATTIEQEVTSSIGSRMPAPEHRPASSGRYASTGVQNCYGTCVDCRFLVGGERPLPDPTKGRYLLPNEHVRNRYLPLENCLDTACARLRTAISQGGKTKMPEGLRKIPLSCFDLVMSIAVFHYASRTLNQSTQNQEPRRLAYERALEDLEKIRKGDLQVEDDDGEEVSSTKTGAEAVRQHGWHAKWSRANYELGGF